MPGLIILGIIVELIRESWINFAFLLTLLLINGLISLQEEKSAEKSIDTIANSLSEFSTVKRDGVWHSIPARELVVGDRIRINTGDIFLADCIVNKGHCEIDQSTISGEVMPIEKSEGDCVYQRCICKAGEIEAIVEATGPRTHQSRISNISTQLGQGGNLQRLLMRVSFLLLMISALLVIIIMVVVLVKGNQFAGSFSICIILMVASIPIAMKAVCSTTMAAGAKSLASKNVLLRRISALEDLAGMQVLCCDKTKILTKNQLNVLDPYCFKHTPKDIMLVAGLASKKQSENQDSIDKAIVDYALQISQINFQWFEEEEFIPFDPRIKRSEACIRNTRTGENFRCTKGAPQIILSMVKDPSIEEEVTKKVEDMASKGYRTLGVARTNTSGNWVMYGLIPLHDPPREDSNDSIQKAINIGIKIKMITGDQIAIARETSRVLSLGDKIYNSEIFSDNANSVQRELVDSIIDDADGFAEVFPEHRFAIVKLLQNKKNKVGITGSRVSDAISLKKADVGIAIEGSCDAAKSVSDIVLKEQGISIIIKAVYLARKTFERMHNYCIYRIACSFQILIFYFLTMVSIDPSEGFRCNGVEDCDKIPNTFAPPVVSIVLLALFNDLIIVSMAYDRVMVSRKPCKWNLLLIMCTSCCLGIVSFFSSLAFLLLTLKNMDNNFPNSFLSAFGIEPLTYGEILTGVFLKISLSIFLTVYSARCKSWFWTRMPGKLVLFSTFMAMIGTTLISIFWFFDFRSNNTSDNPIMKPIKLNLVIFIWVFDIIFFFIQDLLKILMIIGFESYYSIKVKDKEFFPPVLTDTFSQAKEGERRKTIVTQRSYLAANETVRPLSLNLLI
jgi:H+-transporting ATPase